MLVDINSIIPQDGSYDFLIEKFGEEKIAKRYEHIYSMIKDFLNQKQYADKAAISVVNLNHVIIDYFVDIYRLKPFQDIILVNEAKIYAYLSYWLLRHKPIQQFVIDDEDIVFINEEFVTDFILSNVLKELSDYPLIGECRGQVEEFAKTMRYYFQYRTYTPQSIELMLLSFSAGRGLQYSIANQS